MRTSFFLIAMLMAGSMTAQQAVLSKIPKTGTTIEAFIPAGYDTIATASGDLNKDKGEDIVLVLKSKAEDVEIPEGAAADTVAKIEEMPNRILLVLFKNATGYTLAGKSDKAILCDQCGGVFGDPFESVVIEKGVLSIHHYGGSAWRWSYTHKFRWQQNDFFLIGQTSHSFWNVSFCEKLEDFAATDYKDENLVTGDYESKKISEEGCKLLVNKKGKQKVKPLKKLSAFSIEE
jgi:hypothetical protein